jgi:hypothetical protein
MAKLKLSEFEQFDKESQYGSGKTRPKSLLVKIKSNVLRSRTRDQKLHQDPNGGLRPSHNQLYVVCNQKSPETQHMIVSGPCVGPQRRK